MITYEPREVSGALREWRVRRAEQQKNKKRRTTTVVLVILLIASICGGIYALYVHNPPAASAQITQQALATQPVTITWPTTGQAAVGTPETGVLAATESQTPTPTASVAKVMTAVMILKKYPLKVGEQGPSITFTQKDVDSYYTYAAGGGSTVPVEVGSSLTEYQALQAILIPSANNIADSTAIWAYGSMDAYHAAANEYAKSIGMEQSKFSGDASGYSSETVSTPEDLVRLGQAALSEPVLKQITSQTSAELPLAGTVKNTNILLGTDGISGIKTGNTDAAGGCLLSTATKEIDGKLVTVIGAIMKAPDIYGALTSTPPLLNSAFENFSSIAVAKKGSVVGSYNAPWGTRANITASKDLSVLGWIGSNPDITIVTPEITAAQSNDYTGAMTAKTPWDRKTVELELSQPLDPPSLQWRLTNLF